MARFHHLWIVEAELEICNPQPDAESCCERIFGALEHYASEDTDPYPAQVSARDGGWIEVTFPVFTPTRFAAVAAGAAILAEVCRVADANVGVVKVGVGESSEDLTRYNDRVQAMDAAR
jgi:hypothetical protein